jgi:hypothetical protein
MPNSLSEIITDPMQETSCIKCGHLMDISSLPPFTHIACPECGTQQGVPSKLGSFVLVELLGKGGMGAVYRGHDVGLDRWVAVKVMQSSFGGNPEFVETFRREAQAAAALNHPNIVQIYSFGVAHGQPYLVMELLEGGRLDHMIAKGELLNEALILKMAEDIAEGLNAAAAISLIHGDVKPENILMDHNGVAKVVDFGLAQFKAKAEGGTAKGIWGTPYYIAPEKLKGHPADARSDIYSLGGTLFHALSLKPPFEGETPLDVVKARLKAPAPLLHTLRPGVNPEVEGIVARMLEAEPQRRYPNYNSLLCDLRRVRATLAPPPGLIPQTVKKGGKFVLTKKKGAGPAGVMTVSAAGTADSFSSQVATAAGVPPAPFRHWKAVLWSLAGVCVLGGLIGWGLARKASNERKTEADQIKTQVAKALKSAEQIWKELQPIAGDFSNRVIMAGIWSSNAQEVISMVKTGAPALAETAEWVEAGSNATDVAGAVAQFLAGPMAGATNEFKGILETVDTQRKVILTTTNSATALVAITSLTNIPDRVANLHKSVADEMAKIQKGGDAMASRLARLSKEIQAANRAAVDLAEQTAREKAAQEKLEAERLAAEQFEAAKQAKIQADMTALADARKACIELVQQHRFVQALAPIEQAVKQLQTPEGKAKGRHMVKAYKMMADMKAVIIEGVKAEVKANPENGYRFGWMGSKDILGADDTKVTTRDAQYPWESVPPAQMMRFIKYFLEKGDMNRHDQAQHFFAVAFYLNESFEGNEKAGAQASKYLKDAVRVSPRLGEMAKAVLPGLSID